MFIEVLLIHDVKFIDHNCKGDIGLKQPEEDIFLEGTSNIEYIDDIKEKSW